MRHLLTTEGYGIRLRPVRIDDAAFIVWLRNLDHVKGRVGDSATEVASQEKWLNDYFEREGDYYFIIETLNEIRIGTYAIYHLNEPCAEIGRLATRPGVSIGIPASHLILALFYGQMGMKQVRAIVGVTNDKAQSLAHKLGFISVKVERASQVIGGQAIDQVYLLQVAQDWLRARNKLIPLANRAELTIRKWEQTHLRSCAQGPITKT